MKEFDGKPPSIIQQANQLDPEVIRAQRLAELKDIAEYRARKLQAYKDWADPVKRAALQATVQKEIDEARVAYAKMLEKERMGVPQSPMPMTWSEGLHLTPVDKPPPPKRTLWQRLKAWVRGE